MIKLVKVLTHNLVTLVLKHYQICVKIITVDFFRHLNPHKFATTWHAPVSKDIHKRLDRFYVSDSLISSDIIFNFYPVSFSDQDIFSFQFKNFNTPEFGPNYWKFNDSHLEDQEFVKAFINFYKYHTKKLDIYLETWDRLKEKIKNFCILFSKKRSKEKFDALRKLRSEYSRLVQHERNSPGKYFEQVETIRLQIEKLENDNLFGSKVRAKIEVLNDEENPSHFFSKVEQSKSKKKNYF